MLILDGPSSIYLLQIGCSIRVVPVSRQMLNVDVGGCGIWIEVKLVTSAKRSAAEYGIDTHLFIDSVNYFNFLLSLFTSTTT